MTTTLPPDPYLALGVSKDAKLPEIRSAYRKLVLKCHPDKVKDEALKPEKQDEFQKVQQAYETLSDETKRTQYDELVHLFELRKQSRGRTSVFDYEVRNAEPRSSPTAPTRSSPKVYSQPPPRSYEDVMYEEPRSMPRKSSSYESTDKKRSSGREDERERDRRRYEDDERARAKMDKESKRTVHSEKKKSRDKERRSGKEEKTRTRVTGAYVETDSDEYRSPTTRSSDKKSTRKMEDEIRQRNEDAARAQDASARAHQARERERERQPPITTAPLDPKWDEHQNFAAQYMQAARRKAAVADEFHHPGMPRRAETFTSPPQAYTVRYATPQNAQYSDEETPRRSSARKETRRSSEAPAPKREKSSSKSTRRSPTTYQEPFVVEPPSPTVKRPSLQTHSSAPPVIPVYATRDSRKEPSRSKTEYPRSKERDAPPTVTRAQTFTQGDRGRSDGSRLKKQVYASSDSDSDEPTYKAPRQQHPSPPRRPDPPQREPTRYFIDNGRSVPVVKRTAHRSELHSLNTDAEYIHTRERSESPRAIPRRRSPERTSVPRQTSDRPRAAPVRSQSSAYYAAPDAPEPVIVNATRPKMTREGSGSGRRGGANVGGPYFGEVQYSQQYGPESVNYAKHLPPDAYRRGSESHHQRDYAYPIRGRGEQIYAS